MTAAVCRRLGFVLPGLMLCWSVVASAAPLGVFEMQNDLKSLNRAIVYSEKFIDAGDYAKSNQLLAEAIKRYPKSDVLFSLMGKSLYESGHKNRAEDYFMTALRLNSGNILAQRYIEQIRQVRSLTESESDQQWTAIIKDKIGDLIVFVLSVWLGTSLNSVGRFFSRQWRWHQAKRSYARKDYVAVVRILESHARDMEQNDISRWLHFMLSSGQDADKVREILTRYVIREEDLKMLVRSLDLLVM